MVELAHDGHVADMKYNYRLRLKLSIFGYNSSLLLFLSPSFLNILLFRLNLHIVCF